MFGCALSSLSVALLGFVPLQEPQLHRFEKQVLDERFFCEGATFGDVDRDGNADLIAGPFWFAGPDLVQRHEIYSPVAFDKNVYSDNFLTFADDIDGDGWLDVLAIDHPGRAARWYRNPARTLGHWTSFVAYPSVDNESPAYLDLTGDGRRELVFHTGGRFGWAEPDADPTAPWIFHPLSEDRGLTRYTHGLGVGDVDGDGRADVLERTGWWEQPDSLVGEPLWTYHPNGFGDGGAQMFAWDVDDDGDADVITSIQAHGYGLVWFEQRRSGETITFVPHVILGSRPEDNPYGVCFTQMHALDLADMDGDGVLDIITGKRHWAHQGNDPEGKLPPVSYWFRTVRGEDGVDFVPHRIDDDSGVGTQVVTGDVDGDGWRDVVVGNKRGIFFLRHRVESVGSGSGSRTAPKRVPPVKRTSSDEQQAGVVPVDSSGQPLNLGFEDGTLRHWTMTGDAFADQPVEGDTVRGRRGDMASDHDGQHWIGGYERHGDSREGTLTSVPFEVTHPWASFLVNGGASEATRVEVWLRSPSGEERRLAATSGRESENLRRFTLDLRAHAGASIFVRLVDAHRGGWGHLNFDDFRFHSKKPAFPPPSERGGRLPDPPPPLDTIVHAGLSPTAAAEAMTVPEGFEVTLFVGEPDVHQPIAFTFDDRGRLWVAEAYAYPQRVPDDQARDTIVIFEDDDGDGRFDTRKVFADRLNLVSGLEVGFGGVWVGAAPELLFIPDADGDDVPDGEPRVLLDGWGYQDTHETLNTFTWGPDGWLYGCHGVFTHSKVGKPGTPDSERVPLNAGVFRYHPTRHEFEVFAHGTSNPWGIDFNDRGQCFIEACVIPHLFHVIQGARYHRQAGQHFDPNTFDDIKTCADHVHWSGDRGPHAGNQRSDSAGGGHAHAGAMFYLGDQWPAEWRDKLLIHNIHGDRTNVERLERRGSGYVGRHEPDFLLTHDEWSQMINLRVGPDGSVWMIDWYDKQVCHSGNVEAHDRTNGRIYRVRYGQSPSSVPDVAAASVPELVELQLHPNDWVVRHARRRLQELGGGADVHSRLLALVRAQTDETRALRALWALHVTGGLDQTIGLELLGHSSQWVRAWTIQLLHESRRSGPAVRARLATLADRDPSPVVRLYLAAALQRLPDEQRWKVLEGLIRHGEDREDHNLPLMLWYALEPLVSRDAERAWKLVSTSSHTRLIEFAARRITDLGEPKAVAAVVRALTEEGQRQHAHSILTGMQRALEGRRRVPMPSGWSVAADQLENSDSADIRRAVRGLATLFGDPRAFTELRRRLRDASALAADRQAALLALAEVRDAELPPLLLELLGREPSGELRQIALRALARYSGEAIPTAILSVYGRLSGIERREALGTLVARAPWAKRLLAEIDAGRVPVSDLGADLVRRLGNLEDPEITALVASVWGVLRSTPAEKKAQIARTLDILSAGAGDADPHAGRAVFRQTCETCHTLFGTGAQIGPDLTGSNRADLDYLLENVLDPSAVVGKDYLSSLIVTTDERYLTGLVIGEDARRVRLRTVDEEIVVLLEEIADRTRLDSSMMPDGLLNDLTDQQVRDLVAYLAQPSQVPLRATAASTLFNGRDLSGWRGSDAWSVEDGEIVGRTEGLPNNEFLKSELLLSNFRLTIEVKLVGNEGNSGVQFRSREVEGGDVAGYQADIGAGWWGKLYEEHGRALLWDRSGEAAVRSGEWNTYEILAVGSRLRTAINGRLCVDLDDPAGAREGILALQLHSGGATEVRFRDLRLELEPEPVLATVPGGGVR